MRNAVSRLALASWTLVLFLAMTTRIEAQVAPSQQTLLLTDQADGGFFACPEPGETTAAFASRIPLWYVDIERRIPEQPMNYRLYEPIGMRVLVAEGSVEDGESTRLYQALNANWPVDEVWLSSPGGNSAEGLLMAQVLRDRRVVTRVPRGYACISACSTAFLGGSLRYVDSGAIYGIHMFSRADGRLVDALNASGRDSASMMRALRDAFALAEQEAARTASERSRFLMRMGVSLGWMDEAFKTKAACVNYLSRDKLRRLNIVNTG